MEHNASFGQWLMLRRQTLHLQRGELAARIGCAVVTLRKIEADERRPSRELAEQLATQLSIAPHEREIFIRVARGELAVDHLPFPRPSSAVPTNLPIPTTSLVGRAREIEDVCAALSRADVRLLTLTGAPGVGKTRLAMEAASELRSVFADGVFFVDLTPLSEPDLVLVAVAQALRVGLSGGLSRIERLGRYLRARHILLVLDNFEQVLPAAPQLAQLLAAAPHLKLLVTSRVALELSGEHRFTVLPLSVLPVADNGRIQRLAMEGQERSAADLFVQRARTVVPNFELTDENASTITEICQRLDGLPLAIELAAARVALFTPQELLARLDDRFTLLTSRARDLPPRHMALRQAIDWSYGLLAPADQLLFRRLGVFIAPCTIEAAEEVCNSDGSVGVDLVDQITVLMSSSLLQRCEGCDGRSRFGMLETIREYAVEQLVASGEAVIMRQRHASYYLALAEAAAREWDRPAEPAWLRRLAAVRENLRAALRWALDTQDAAIALRLNSALFSFWLYCSNVTEARGWLEATLALPRPEPVPEIVAAEAKVLNAAGYAAAAALDYTPAYAYFERGLALYRTLDDRRGVAWSMRGCAMVHMLCGEYAAAEHLDTESLQICRSSGDAWGEAWSLYALAFLKLVQDDLTQAQQALEDALVHLRRQGITVGIFRTLLALGHVQFAQDDLARAQALYREGLALSREMPLLTNIATGLEGFAAVAATVGLPVQAARFWGAAEALREATGEGRPPFLQHTHDQALAAARTQVSKVDWMAAWAAGRALTADQAVAEALADVDTSVSVDELFPLVGSGPL